MTPTPTPPSRLPTAFTIDIDQWQRDIQTFRDMTHSELQKIASELSIHCTDGTTTSSLPSFVDNTPAESTPSPASTFNEKTLGDTAFHPPKESTSRATNSRLSKLEEELSRRLSGGNRSIPNPNES